MAQYIDKEWRKPVGVGSTHPTNPRGYADSTKQEKEINGESVSPSVRLRTAEIWLGRGFKAVIDEADLWLFWGRSVYAKICKNGPYAFAQLGGREIPFSRLVLAVPHGVLVDHENGDSLDNRRENLRAATYKQNAQNQAKKRLNNQGHVPSTKFRGVHWAKNNAGSSRGAWRAQIRGVDGRQVSLGQFQDVETAARAYDSAAVRLHSEFARLNFPEKPSAPDSYVSVGLREIQGGAK